MKKLLLVIALAFMLVGWTGYHNLKHDFNYLYKWAASQMKVKIDSKKPVPKLAFIAEKDLTKLIEKQYKMKTKYEGKGIKLTLGFYGIYVPEENTIYINSDEGDIEKEIVHELVHYIQYSYYGFKENNPEREAEATRIADFFAADQKMK